MEILADRTEQSQTFANPDGTFTYRSYGTPHWVRRGGSWVTADATLAALPGGGYAPRAAEHGLVLSGGGDQALATLSSGAASLSVFWPAALPRPSVSGATARYVDVLPGVDLDVTATAQGAFSEVLVVRDAAAARDPRLADLELRVQASRGLTVSADATGALTARDAAGTALFGSPAPKAWDSYGSAAGRVGTVSSTAGPGAAAHVAGIAVSYAAGRERLSVPRALLAGSAAFPVFIDPTYTVTSPWSAFAELQSAYPSTNESDPSTTPRVALGYSGTGVDRACYELGVPSAVGGAVVLSASLSSEVLTAYSSATTTDTLDLYLTSQLTNTAATWANQPTQTAGPIAVNVTTASTTPNATVSFNVTSWVQAVAAGYGWQLSAMVVNGSETSTAHFVTLTDYPSMTIVYDHAPAGASGLAVTPSLWASDGNLYTGTATPAFSAQAADQDGDPVQYQFQVLSGSTVVATGTTAYLASGTTGSWTDTTALADNGTYTFQVRATDGTEWNAWSYAVTFTVQTDTPAAPAVTCAGYPAGTWTAAVIAGGTTCSWNAPLTHMNGYTIDLDGTYSWTSGTSTSINPGVGLHTLTVQPQSAAGTTGATATYVFGIGTATVTAPANGSSSDGVAVALSATSAPGLVGVRYQYRLGSSGAFADLPVGDVTNGGTVLGAWPVATATNGSSPALVWNAAHTVAANGLVQVRAVFNDASGATVVSAPVGFTLGLAVPAVPASVTATTRDGGAIVAWTAPASGPAVTGYTVTASLSGATVGTPVTVSATTLRTELTGLTNGTTYTIKVAATNAYGAGPAATTTVTPAAATAPGQVTALTVAPGAAKATVTWTPPGSDGGADLTAAVVEIHASADASLIATQTFAATVTQATISALPWGENLYAVVYVRNASGLTGSPVASAAFVVTQPLTLTGLGVWHTSDPSTGAAMDCVLWQFTGPHPGSVAGQIHYQLVSTASGSTPKASTDWSITYTAAGNYSGSGGEYSWCADTSVLPVSASGYEWTPVALTGDDGQGGTLSLGNAALAGLTMLDPDGNTDPAVFTVPASTGSAVAVRE